MPEPPDAYKVLQVDPEAEDEVIQAAYRRLARKYHPDLAGGAEAAARMAAINAAWELIGEPTTRAVYDRARKSPTSRPAGSGNAQAAAGPDRARPATHPRPSPAPPPPETVSRDWTSGRSTLGGGFDDSMRAAEGLGAAGPPPGRPSGSVLNFGRYAGWSLGEIARRDPQFLEWLDRMPIGRPYRDEIERLLRGAGVRAAPQADPHDRNQRRR